MEEGIFKTEIRVDGEKKEAGAGKRALLPVAHIQHLEGGEIILAIQFRPHLSAFT